MAFNGGSSANNPATSSGSKGPLMDETKLVKYKTVMCQRMVRVGTCRYGHLCDFAHDPHELRRNLNQHWYQGVMCEIPDHDDKKCEFAHNEMELMYHPNIYKTKLCDKFQSSGGCPKNQYCAMAHGKSDLRTPKQPGQGMTKPPTSPSNRPSVVSGSSPPGPSSKIAGSFDQRSSTLRQQTPPSEIAVPAPAATAAHRQQSFPTYAESAAPRVALSLSQSELQQEFQDTTNDLKIRILDLVDQISSMHTDRANYESHHKANQLVQDAYKAHREQMAVLQRQIDNCRLMIQLQQGNPAVLARLSPAALQQLARRSSQSANVITSYNPPSSPAHSLIKDLAEIDIS